MTDPLLATSLSENKFTSEYLIWRRKLSRAMVGKEYTKNVSKTDNNVYYSASLDEMKKNWESIQGKDNNKVYD